MSKWRIDIAMMGKPDQTERQSRQMDTERQTHWQTDMYRPHRCVQSIAFFTDWLSSLSRSLFFSLCLSHHGQNVFMQSLVSLANMICKSIINYKYSIASLQSATEIGADNLQKQKKVCFLWNPVCVCVCICESARVLLCIHQD